MYRVFIGAPTAKELSERNNTSTDFHWEMLSATEDVNPTPSPSVPLPRATLEEASRRVSDLYRNALFDECEGVSFESEWEGVSRSHDQTTLYSWPPTALSTEEELDDSEATQSSADLSQSRELSKHESQISDEQTQYETQYTDPSSAGSASSSYGESSIAFFPQFHFSVNSLTSLSSLKSGYNEKMSFLLAVLEVDGPDIIRLKTGKDAGSEVAILKMILGDENGKICKLTAWREIAETWGGGGNEIRVKRGDVIFLENITRVNGPKNATPMLTASPFSKSAMTICYRTMPYTKEDTLLRPDLRLSETDSCVRKVSLVVKWFQEMAGLGDV